MVKQEKTIAENGVDFGTLGIVETEVDRFELDERGPFQITRFRLDPNTQYNKELGGILKFDGIDIATGQEVKYRTTSTVITGNFKTISDKVGVKEQDDAETGITWSILIKPVNVKGFEWKKTKNGKYLKITG
jgi:hypothetical protein